MPRYRMTVEYDGTPYKGWQRQKNGHSVQAAIEAAIARFARENVTLQVAGRTDAGVHATGQVSHADLERDWAPFKFHEAVNAMLREAGEAVSVLSVEKAEEGFHARFPPPAAIISTASSTAALRWRWSATAPGG